MAAALTSVSSSYNKLHFNQNIPELIFANPQIDKNVAVSLLRSMLHSGSILAVSENNILQVFFDKPVEVKSVAVIQAIFELIGSLKALEKVEGISFANCQMDAPVTEMILAGLNANERLTTVSFSSCSLGLSTLFQTAQPFHSRLESFEFSNQRLEPANLRTLGLFLSQNPGPPLKKLCLQNNNLTDAQVIELAESLIKNSKLLALYLGTNDISDAGTVALAGMIEEHPTLAALSLRDNNIGDAGAMALGLALRKRKSETKFDLGLEGNSPLTTAGAEYLVDKGDPKLQKLGLRDVKNLKTLGVLEKAVSKRSLQALSIGYTGITDEDVKEFTAKRPRPTVGKMEIFVSRATLRPESIEALQNYFQGSGINVNCDPLTNDDRKYVALIDAISRTTRPEKSTLDAILAVPGLSDRQSLFGLFLSKVFDVAEIDKDGNCLFNSIAEGWMDIDFFGANKFFVNYLDKYRNDFPDMIKKFENSNLGIALRLFAIHFMERHPENFKPFISEEDFDEGVEIGDLNQRFAMYCQQMKQPGTYGGDKEIQAIMGLFEEYNVPLELIVLDPSKPPDISTEGEFITPGLLNRANTGEVSLPAKKIYLSYEAAGLHYNLLHKRAE